MRIAFVHIPRFLCAVEVQRDPRLASRPLIIGDEEQPKRVLEFSAQAGAEGVRSGMPIRRALSLCPEAAVIAPDPVLYNSRWNLVLAAMDEVSPEVEEAGVGDAYLNAGGLRLHYRNEEGLAEQIGAQILEASGLTASIGLASSKFTALAAAQETPSGSTRVIEAGQEACFLASLPIEMLPVSPEILYRLQVFGLHCIGDVAAIPAPLLQGQFGWEGNRLWQLANGRDDEPLFSRPRLEVITARLSFEEPVGGLEVMVAAAKQLLSRLRMPLRGRAVRELTLEAELASQRSWARHIVLREAVSEDDRLVFVLRNTLQNAPPPQAIRSLSLCLGGIAGETGKQMTLGQKGRLQSQLEEAIRQLKVRYGYSPIYRCVDIDSWSVVPEERQILVESDA